MLTLRVWLHHYTGHHVSVRGEVILKQQPFEWHGVNIQSVECQAPCGFFMQHATHKCSAWTTAGCHIQELQSLLWLRCKILHVGDGAREGSLEACFLYDHPPSLQWLGTLCVVLHPSALWPSPTLQWLVTLCVVLHPSALWPSPTLQWLVTLCVVLHPSALWPSPQPAVVGDSLCSNSLGSLMSLCFMTIPPACSGWWLFV